MKQTGKFFIAGVLCLATLTGAACQAPSNEPIELLNFTSYEKEVKLGSLYSLPPAIVEGNNGKDYKVEYVIENELSEEVQVNNNQIVIGNLKDYIITCKVTLDNQEVVTRTITLNVKDEKEPTITLGTIAPGFVDTEYVIPVTVTDDSGEIKATEYTVTYVQDGVETNVPAQDGKFTPTKIGEYAVTVKATDMQDNSAETSFSMYVRTPILANEVLSFGMPSDVSNVKSYGGDGATAEHLREFAGESGVVKLTNYNTWPYMQFKPLREMADYADYDEIVFRMYFPKSGEYANADGTYVKYMKLGNNTVDDILPKNVTTAFSADMYDKWVDLVFDAETFKTYWTDDLQFSMSSTAPRLWGNSTAGENGTTGSYYLADISVRKSLNITSTDISVDANQIATVPTLSVSLQSGTKLTENEDYTVTSLVTWDDGAPKDYQPNDTTFLADEVGATYTVTYNVVHEGFTYVFIKTLTIPRTYEDDEVLSFVARADLEKVTVNGGEKPSKTWLKEYEGETGVLQATYTGSWPSIFFVPNQDMTAYTNATKIVFRMYISDAGDTPIKAIVLGANTGNDIVINLTADQYNTWVDFEFDISVFNEYWKTDGTMNTGKARLWMYTKAGEVSTGESNFYIAGIWVE